jgi:hypothetical protein
MKNEKNGIWKLVRCYDKVEDLDKLRNKHAAVMRKLPTKERIH